jgi:membrane fusion protein, multidrug efflux system
LVGSEYAYEQAPIMTIAQINPLNVEVFVPIALYGAINIGMEAIVFGEQPVGGQYTATVDVIDPVIDSRSDTFGIRLVLPNPDNKIPAGLRCKVEFPVRLGCGDVRTIQAGCEDFCFAPQAEIGQACSPLFNWV